MIWLMFNFSIMTFKVPQGILLVAFFVFMVEGF